MSSHIAQPCPPTSSAWYHPDAPQDPSVGWQYRNSSSHSHRPIPPLQILVPPHVPVHSWPAHLKQQTLSSLLHPQPAREVGCIHPTAPHPYSGVCMTCETLKPTLLTRSSFLWPASRSNLPRGSGVAWGTIQPHIHSQLAWQLWLSIGPGDQPPSKTQEEQLSNAFPLGMTNWPLAGADGSLTGADGNCSS